MVLVYLYNLPTMLLRISFHVTDSPFVDGEDQ